MPFIDAVNRMQGLLQSYQTPEVDPINGSDIFRVVILDEKRNLSFLESSLQSYMGNMELCRITDNSSDKISSFSTAPNNGILYLILVIEAGKTELLHEYLSSLKNKIVDQSNYTGLPVSAILCMTIIQLIPLNCYDHAKQLASDLAPVLHELLENGFVPKMSVLTKLIDNRNPDISQNMVSEEIHFLLSKKLSPSAQDTDFSPVDLFKENDYPWFSYHIIETYSLEIVLMQWLNEKLRSMLSASMNDVENELTGKSTIIKQTILKEIGFSELEEINKRFQEWLEYVPIEISKEEWERNNDIETFEKTEMKTTYKHIFFKKTETITKKEKRLIGTPCNNDPSVLKNNFITYLIQKMQPENLCYFIFESLTKIKSNLSEPEYNSLYQWIQGIIESTFTTNFDDYHVWNEIKKYYASHITMDVMKNCYSRITSTIQRVCNKIASQISSWTILAPTASNLQYDETRDFFHIARNEEGIYQQLAYYFSEMQNQSKYPDFHNSISELINQIDDHSLITRRLHSLHRLILHDYLAEKSNDAYKRIETPRKLKSRICYYYQLDSLNYMVGQESVNNKEGKS